MADILVGYLVRKSPSMRRPFPYISPSHSLILYGVCSIKRSGFSSIGKGEEVRRKKMSE